jgi:hypothetical protein
VVGRLQEEEPDGHAFFEPGEAAARLGPVAARLPVVLRARAAKSLLSMSES